MVNTLDPPSSVIAKWPKPNYVNPVQSGPELEIVVYISTILAIVAVLARLYARFFITKSAGVDDLLVVIGLFFAVGVSVLVLIARYKYYTGYHVWDVPLQIFTPQRRLCWITQFLYLVAAGCVRISVLLFYRRLSVSFTRTFLIAVWFGVVCNFLLTLGFLAYLVSICRPIDSYWNRYNLEWYMNHVGKWSCSSEQASLVLHGVLSSVADLYATILPCLLIQHLTFSRRQRWALYGLFGMGYFVVGASICRTVFVYILIDVDYDFTWALTMTWMFCVVELMIAVLAASGPALKPFFGHFFSGVVSRRSDEEISTGPSLTMCERIDGDQDSKRMISNASSVSGSGDNRPAERHHSMAISEKTCVTIHQLEDDYLPS